MVPSQIAERQESAVEAHISEISPSDEILMAEVCLGSREVLAILFRRYARLVRGVALRVLKDPSEADDLLQDVFLLIHRFCRTFDSSKASAQFWILQMRLTAAPSRGGVISIPAISTAKWNSMTNQSRSRNGDPSTSTIQFTKFWLNWTCRRCSESYRKTSRRLLGCTFIERYTLDEIAKMLGQTKGNVRHHSFRGLERLRKQIFGGKLSGAKAV